MSGAGCLLLHTSEGGQKGPAPKRSGTGRARTNHTKFKGCRIVGVGARPKIKTTYTQFKGWPVRGVGAASDRIGTPGGRQARQRSSKGGRESSLRSGWDTRGRAEYKTKRKDETSQREGSEHHRIVRERVC